MMLARVIGTLVATVKHPAYEGRRVVMLQPLDADQQPQGGPLYAVGTQQAGVGDLVLAVKEGGSARLLCEAGDEPIHAAVVGIVDEVQAF